MRFWDSSAIIPLLIEEKQSNFVSKRLKQDLELWVWWGSIVECRSAIARRAREKLISIDGRTEALKFLDELSLNWHEVQPSNLVRNIAIRLVAVHNLKAADSFQLAAALALCEQNPSGENFLTFDERLGEAASIEGFIVEGV